MPLVLSRKKDEGFMIGDDIRVFIVEIKRGAVRIGIDCPRDTPVHRDEIYRQVKEQGGEVKVPFVQRRIWDEGDMVMCPTAAGVFQGQVVGASYLPTHDGATTMDWRYKIRHEGRDTLVRPWQRQLQKHNEWE